MQRLVRLLVVIGLSAAGLVGAGCSAETSAQLRDAVINGAATFVETTTIEWLDALFASAGP